MITGSHCRILCIKKLAIKAYLRTAFGLLA